MTRQQGQGTKDRTLRTGQPDYIGKDRREGEDKNRVAKFRNTVLNYAAPQMSASSSNQIFVLNMESKIIILIRICLEIKISLKVFATKTLGSY
jgi:hypothetical protein